MRVVGGRYRGRRLSAPAGRATRPTVERVREALFNVLDVQGLRVLDCYAGSGALGIEALSRGADHVVFVEKARQAVQVVRSNLAVVETGDDATASEVIQSSLEQSVQRLKGMEPFDLWLVDPPFSQVRDGQTSRALSLLFRAGILAPDGLVVVEYPRDQPCPVVDGLSQESIRNYGDSRLAFLRG